MECYEVEYFSSPTAWPIPYYADQAEIEFYQELTEDMDPELAECINYKGPSRYFPAFEVDCREVWNASNETNNVKPAPWFSLSTQSYSL